MKKRMCLDILMLILFLVVMDRHYTQNTIHEIISISWLLLFAIHMKFNLGWFKGLVKGTWNTFRMSVAIVDSIILLSFIGSMVTGILISKFLFSGYFSSELVNSLYAHQLHHMFPRVLMISMGIHLGLHWHVWWHKLKNIIGITKESGVYRIICYGILIAIICMGIYASFTYRVGDRILMVSMKQFNRTVNTDILPFAMWHASIIGLYAIIGYYFHRWLRLR